MPQIVSFGQSDVGLYRSNNEDAFFVSTEFRLNVLADGMGGAAAGEIASKIFTETAVEVFSGARARSAEEDLKLIHKSYALANSRILSHTEENPHHLGMGCTAEILSFCDREFTLGHIGDSRIYLYRNAILTQLTRDHSYVQSQVEQGLMTPLEARTHRLRNVILRAVGTTEDLPADLIRGSVSPGDLFLVCSDGLTDMVDDEDIEKALSLPSSIAAKVETLVDYAKGAGGRDNITVILTEILEE